MRSLSVAALLLLTACGAEAVLELPRGHGPEPTPKPSSPPVEPRAETTRAVASAGGVACTITGAGTVECWGRWMGFVYSRTEDLGPQPTVIAGIDRAVAVAVAPGHACAARDDGAVYCWGFDSQGQLGLPRTAINDPYVFQAEAVRVEGITSAVDVAVGWLHSCAHLRDGTVTCWGSNALSSLGDSARTPWSSTPVVVEGLDRVTRLDAATGYTCAIRAAAELWCWGECAYDTCGTAGRAQLPRRIETAGPVRDVAIGNHRLVILGQDGSLSSTGIRMPEASERGTYAHDATPTVFAQAPGAIAVAGAGSVTCVILADGGASCLGDNRTGALGRGVATTAWESALAPVVELSDVVELASGGPFCALERTGVLSCWGSNASGQVADGTVGAKSPAEARAIVAEADAVSSGQRFACAVHRGAVSCWGANDRGQLGDGTTHGSAVPVRVAGIDDARSVSAGPDYACAVRDGGALSCWGAGDKGQLGRGRGADAPRAREVPGLLATRAVATAPDHACALDDRGAVTCWGANDLGQAAGDPLAPSIGPTPIAGVVGAIEIAVGGTYACALGGEGRVWCWGQDRYGSIGFVPDPFDPQRLEGGAARRHLQPVAHALANVEGVRHLAAFDASLCVADAAGARCFGGNRPELSIETPGIDAISAGSNGFRGVLCALVGSQPRCTAGDVPYDLAPIGPVRAVAVGFPVCVLGADRAVRCTGTNERGELGDGEGYYTRPRRVRGS